MVVSVLRLGLLVVVVTLGVPHSYLKMKLRGKRKLPTVMSFKLSSHLPSLSSRYALDGLRLLASVILRSHLHINGCACRVAVRVLRVWT